MSKDTFKQAADALFASTAHNVLWANPKGEFFTSENSCALSLKAGQKPTKFERPEKPEASKDSSTADEKVYEFNAITTIAKIKAVDSLEALASFEGDQRKSVLAVYESKKAELIAAIDLVGATTETGDTKGTKGTETGNEDTDTQK